MLTKREYDTASKDSAAMWSELDDLAKLEAALNAARDALKSHWNKHKNIDGDDVAEGGIAAALDQIGKRQAEIEPAVKTLDQKMNEREWALVA